MNKKATYLTLLLICFFIILLSTTFAVRGFDIIAFTTNNIIKYPIIYMISISLMFVIPILSYKKNIYEIVLTLIIFFNLFINLLLISYFSFAYAWGYFYQIFNDTESVISILVMNSIIGLLVSIMILINKLKEKKLGEIIHSSFLVIYIMIHVLWFLGVKYESNDVPNLFEPRPYDFIYQLLIVLKGGYLFLSSMIIIYLTFNRFTKKLSKNINSNLNKTSKILIWFFFGFFGFERLFDENKKWITNFQVISASFVIGYLIAMNIMYFNVNFNILFFFVFLGFVLSKVIVWIISFLGILMD